ncbi:MAG: hypothetical protein ACLVLH_01235 [Eisenbergiella massiliensis]
MYHVSTSLTSGIDLYDAKDKFDFLVSPLFLDGSAQPEKKYEDYSHAASGIRFLKAIAPEKQSVALSGGNGTKWRYVTAPRLKTGYGCGKRSAREETCGTTTLTDSIRETPWTEEMRAGKEIYHYLKENAPFLNGQIPEGNRHLYSRATRDVGKGQYGGG